MNIARLQRIWDVTRGKTFWFVDVKKSMTEAKICPPEIIYPTANFFSNDLSHEAAKKIYLTLDGEKTKGARSRQRYKWLKSPYDAQSLPKLAPSPSVKILKKEPVKLSKTEKNQFTSLNISTEQFLQQASDLLGFRSFVIDDLVDQVVGSRSFIYRKIQAAIAVGRLTSQEVFSKAGARPRVQYNWVMKTPEKEDLERLRFTFSEADCLRDMQEFRGILKKLSSRDSTDFCRTNFRAHARDKVSEPDVFLQRLVNLGVFTVIIDDVDEKHYSIDPEKFRLCYQRVELALQIHAQIQTNTERLTNVLGEKEKTAQLNKSEADYRREVLQKRIAEYQALLLEAQTELKELKVHSADSHEKDSILLQSYNMEIESISRKNQLLEKLLLKPTAEIEAVLARLVPKA